MSNDELAALQEQRAEEYLKMKAILARSNGSLGHNDAEAFDRIEARFDELDKQITDEQAEQARARGTTVTPRSRPTTGTPADRLQSRDRSDRAIGHGYGSVDRSLTDGVFLRRDARMQDWVVERGIAQRDNDVFGVDEQREFSAGRLIRGLVTGNWQDADAEHRALNSGASATGGVLVPTLTSAEVIDLLSNQAQVFAAGAQRVPMGSKSIVLPKLAGLPTPGWRGESASVALSDPSFSGVTLTAKTLAVLVKVPYELMEDLSPEAADAITATLVKALALEVDRAGLYGSGTGDEPQGLKGTTGVNVASIATNGATPTDWTPLSKAAFAVRQRNSSPNAAIMSERSAETFDGLVDSTGQPLNPPASVAALDLFATQQIPNDLDEGTSTDVASDLIVGDFRHLAVGFRPEIGIRVASSKEAYIDTMEVALLAFVRADVAVLQPDAFEITTGILA